MLLSRLLKSRMGGYGNAPDETRVPGHLESLPQDHIVGLPDGVGQEAVIPGVGGPGENDIKNNEACSPGGQAPHQLGVQAAGPRPMPTTSPPRIPKDWEHRM